jgi:alkanesulfonate monooxygenase SsuD/methylene tetrahydromethanopterin reductase-like flavin-dependent oxidoreductase (luciferase family)
MTDQLRYAIGAPNVGLFGDPLLLVDLAIAAEEAGWDGFFVWDHTLYRDSKWHVADPVVVSAAVATRTKRIRFGILVNVLARRRIAKVARESVTLDRLSGGRLVVGAGLGSLPAEFESFGESADTGDRAKLLDESLFLLDALWSGKTVNYWGDRLVAKDVTMLPVPVQRPRIPIWCGGRWPNRPPFERAALWDGVMPIHANYRVGQTMPPDEFRDVVRYTLDHRVAAGPFEIALEGQSVGAAPELGASLVRPYAEAGLTWWVEALGWWRGDAADAITRVQQGPPRLD